MVTKTEEGLFRPYAPPANVIAVLQRIRRMNMPPKMSKEFYVGAGISLNIISRVTAALKFLGLIDDGDKPTDGFRALGSSSEEEYRQLLEQTIRTAYAADFQNINPLTDPQEKIVDTFQRYTPKSQHSRQVMLLLGLCREAGMEVVDSPRERPMQPRGKTKRIPDQPQSRNTGDTKTRKNRPIETTVSGGLLFGVTEDDIAALPPEEFQEVWTALGKVALARAKSNRQQVDSDDTEEEE